MYLLLLATIFFSTCSQEKNKIAENTYVVVTGKILAASDNNAAAICPASLFEKSAERATCRNGGGKTIKLTFHRTSSDIIMLAVTTDLARLPANHPGWSVNQSSLVCSGTNICQEQCNLKLTYTPTKDRLVSVIYLHYEYLVNGKKRLKNNRISIVYNPASPVVTSEETS